MKTKLGILAGLLMGTLSAIRAQTLQPTSGQTTNVYVRDMESSVVQLRDDIDALKRALERDLEALRSQVVALSKQIGERRGLASPFDSLERRVSDLERDLKDIESTLRRLDGRIQKLESKR